MQTTSWSEFDLEIHALHQRGAFNEAMTKVISTYNRRILGFLAQRLGPSRAEEAYSTFLYRAYRAFPGFRWETSLKSWLFLVAQSVVRETLRGAPQADPLSSLDEEPDIIDTARSAASLIEIKQRRSWVTELIHRLSTADQEILQLATQELSYAEISNRLGVSPDAAAKRFERAKRRFRELAEKVGLT